MNVVNTDYRQEDVIQFLKEEFERIITQYPRQRECLLSEAQALAIWFLHQETGLTYDDANQFVLDDTNDCGVDILWPDKNNNQILVGQIEYDANPWSRNPASQVKAIDTFKEFATYIESSVLPNRLREAAKPLWREARRLHTDKQHQLRYVFITPKYFNSQQEAKIRELSGILDYEFFTFDTLIERGQEFIDGQTGMTSFELPIMNAPLRINYDYCSVYVVNVNIKEIHKIVEYHEKNKRLQSLFASNVRGYLSTKKRSKEIADAIRSTIKYQPDHFLICNNGITMQATEVLPSNHVLKLRRASISNGCQTVMNIDRYFKDNEGANPLADVLVTIIELQKDAPNITGEIARARNFQNPVDNRDLMSNHPLLVTLHHRLSADRLYGSNKRYYLLRKQGEKQNLLKQEPAAKGSFQWIDADDLARCLAAVVRQEPYVSRQGTNDLFGKYFSSIFPGVHDPSHSRCKFAYWLVKMIDRSYDPKSKWKGIKDSQIRRQRDFKGHAEWCAASLISRQLQDQFSFKENLEKRFVEKCEKWRFRRSGNELEEFEKVTFDMIDYSFRLLHAISKKLLGVKLPKARDAYATYEDMFKGPNYDFIISRIKKGDMKTYQDALWRSMRRFVEYLRDN